MTNWDDLEQFTDIGFRAATSDYPFITLTKEKSMIFNSSFCKKHGDHIENAYGIVFSYSKANNAMAFEFTNDKYAIGLLKISKSKKRFPSVAVRSFLNHIGVEDVICYKYIPVLENINGKEFFVIYFDKKIKKRKYKTH